MKLSNKLLTLAGGVVVAAGISTSAQAGTMNFGGISVPTGVVGLARGTITADFQANAVAEAFGTVDLIAEPLSGAAGDSNVAPGTVTYNGLGGGFPQLTYTLDLTVGAVNPVDADTVELTLTSGSVNYWVDSGASAFDGSFASANDCGAQCSLWVSANLVGTEVLTIDLGPSGGIDTDTNGINFEVGTTAAGTGLFNENFDSNMVNGHDIFTFSASATGSFNFVDGELTGRAIGDTSTNFFAVPEPAVLGLFGIGLIGLGALSRRRKA